MNRTMLSVIIFSLFWSVMACGGGTVSGGEEQEERFTPSSILVFTKTEGYRHGSIPDGIALMDEFGETEANLSVTLTEDASNFNAGTLENYGAVMFLNTTGNVLNEQQQQALKNFIQNGGGFMGVHSATDTEYNWPWYGEMIGAYFDSHPAVQQADLFVLRNDHPATEFLPGVWTRTDEWYNFRDMQDYITPLISIDGTSYEGGDGENHPVAWYHEFEGGRVFYTAGGHTSESYDDPQFTRHLLGGIKYVLRMGE